MRKLLDIIFPPKCPFCGEILEHEMPVCSTCMGKLPFIEGKACKKCGTSLGEFSQDLCRVCHNNKRYFDRVFPALAYSDDARASIVRFKHYSHPSYAYAFAFLLANKILQSEEFIRGFDFITYVPQSRKTRFKRGYNQSYLLAKHLSKILSLPVKDTLLRTDAGENQATLSARKRQENVKKCFFTRDTELNGSALLVDDVFTTGATASYCSKLLKKMGCKNVYVAVCAIRNLE